ncbi:MAG: hypothetical protein DHS20C14_02130 [Phycisphaeraceae bacterium]|nr:MAG: hypothetical protein DHS20C14_02130 [Phycisphaeraceae bacterium]
MTHPANTPLVPIFSPEGFQAFTGAHAIVAAVCVALIVGSVVLGRRWRDTPKEKRLRFIWIWTTILWQTGAVVWWLLPANFDPTSSLPIHLCDLAAWLAPITLWTQHRMLRPLLYFWGVGLSTQAFVTPVLTQGYEHAEFWMFWIGHLQIVGSAVYDAAVLGYRPTFAHWWRVGIFNIAFAALMVLMNEIIVPACFACGGTNYWYVGRMLPESKTLLNALGPWPGRVFWLMLLAETAQLIAWIPWGIAAAIQRRRAPSR